jgi:secondary thiamine-phosphate synthase enzyme
MKIFKKNINFDTKKQTDFFDVTSEVQEIVNESGIREGQVLVYSPHATMSVAVNHNEPMLIQDFIRSFHRLLPTDDQYAHDLFEIKKGRKSDGRSNGHSHTKALLLRVSETLPVEKGRVLITDKQNIFAVDFDGPRKRDLMIQVIGL